MRSFGKIVLPLLFIFTLLYVPASISLADSTLLDGVEFERGYRNYYAHSESSGFMGWQYAICGDSNKTFWASIVEGDNTIDIYDNWTFNQQGLYNRCPRTVESLNVTLYGIYEGELWDNGCRSCSDTFNNDTGFQCLDGTVNSIVIYFTAGSVTERNNMPCSQDCVNLYKACGRPVSLNTIVWQNTSYIKDDSSYTLKLACEGEKIANILRITAYAAEIYSESEPSGKEFLVNDVPPFEIQQTYLDYIEGLQVYFWRGWLRWDIPINARCGESVTVTPSLTRGYSNTKVNIIKAIFDCPVKIDISPAEVMPKKTGNNVADVAVTLLTPAPSGGVDVKLTVEVVKNSGGHIEDEHTGNRLKGEITDETGSKIDTISFAESETQKQVKYKASEVAGEEKIIAEIEGKGRCEKIVRAQVPGLMRLDDGENYDLKESTSIHPSSYWGAMDSLGYFISIANAYAVTFPNDERLVVTDISLPWGGIFDLCGTYNSKDKCSAATNGGHSSHRIGRNVDVRNWNIPEKNRAQFEKICKDYRAIPNDHGNHYHLNFK